jgi:hypothetical protein
MLKTLLKTLIIAFKKNEFFTFPVENSVQNVKRCEKVHCNAKGEKIFVWLNARAEHDTMIVSSLYAYMAIPVSAGRPLSLRPVA